MGKDKGKSNKRGGGKIYIENVEEMEIQEAKIKENQLERAKRRQEEDDDDDNEEGDDNNQQNKAVESIERGVTKVSISSTNKPEIVKGKAIIQNDPLANTEDVGMSRREREAIEAAERKADYERRHLAGETEQAKADLARLAIVRQKREEARLKREAEGRAPGYTQRGIESSSDDSESDDENIPKSKAVAPVPPTAALSEAAAKKKANAEAPDKGVDTETKLKAIDIKKMNADALKEHLKARNLDIQGQKKDLMKRLIDYEATR
eukprot:CAMPEP_0196763658 /NCGR_PEP_ID=MMETSP1095-20130614/4472_1 /TAXON_ID=96789 ORGANISM="Chromulina nebulosa, Strain UTEXLB2642" /NCGR_SAMPLE_ID=MMETSP1095 /ASSEMBLY_ACC=CAM_ASM_000446 /LENGTH=263 /DNA_ID=CAMNT_0042117283 /DNA_START=37 /DNA_END=828 /DNA_ORIENTATION=-